MNPEQAADMMTNPDGTVDMTDDDDMMGPEGDTGTETPGVSGSKSMVDRLLATEPHTPLDQIENPYDPEHGGLTRVYRGIQKLGDIEGLPAIADIVIGAIETQAGSGLFETDSEDSQTDNKDSQTDIEIEGTL